MTTYIVESEINDSVETADFTAWSSLSYDQVVFGHDVINGVNIGDASDIPTSANTVNLNANADASITGSAGFRIGENSFGSLTGERDVEDYYIFVAPATGVATFSLSGLSQDLDLYLYSSVGDDLGHSIGLEASSETIEYTLTAGDSYYINVYAYDSSRSNYSLSLDLYASATSTRSFEVRENQEEVSRLYTAVFTRNPDGEGLAAWVNHLAVGNTIQDVAQAFTESDEFSLLYGESVSNGTFVDLLYTNILGRNADDSGYDYWLNEMSQGTSRGDIIVGFSNSPEYIDSTEHQINLYLSGVSLDDYILI